MKCLWKLAKTIQDSLRSNTLNPDELLFEINRFFIATPPTEWKRRATEKVPLGEMPLRTVKTLLLELVNGLGDAIFHHLTLIEDPQRSSVYPYLHHMLEACRKKDRVQQQQQQQLSPRLQQQSVNQPPQQHEDNRYLSHSRNSSLSRSASVSSFKSNNMLRTPSLASHPSADGDHHNENVPISASHSPRLSTPSITNNHAQPMQIDDPLPPTSQTNNSGAPQAITDYDLNVTLTKIFHKIGTRDETKQVKLEFICVLW